MKIEEAQIQDIAAQLRKPQGDLGIEIGNMMNVGNGPMNRHSLAALAVQPKDHILEIGMGNGHFVSHILSIHSDTSYTGLDYSAEMVAQASQNNRSWVNAQRAKFVEGDLANLPFEEASFSKAFSVNTLYFWEDHAQNFKELHRVLQPEGSLVLSIRPKHIMEKMPVTQFGFNLFTAFEAAALMEANGFSIVGITEVKEPAQQRLGERMELECVILEGRKQ